MRIQMSQAELIKALDYYLRTKMLAPGGAARVIEVEADKDFRPGGINDTLHVEIVTEDFSETDDGGTP